MNNALHQQNAAVDIPPIQATRRFESFAQNCEDVMLRRVFPNNDGFYIDVGAQHPVTDSVTYAFYRDGWRGINIEPSPPYFNKLQKNRQRDINLCVAVSDREGEVEFHDLVGSGLSTIDATNAQRAQSLGYKSVVRKVPCTTLDQICHDNGVTRVDFLKIDVEGAEGNVLRGFSFKNVRPVVLVVEATEPNSPVLSYKSWEPYVLDKGYQMVYTDALNRFYLANEHAQLADRFKYPPNVFDKFHRHIGIKEAAIQVLHGYPRAFNAVKLLKQRASHLLHLIV